MKTYLDDQKGTFIITYTRKYYLNYCVPQTNKKDYKNGLKHYIAAMVGMKTRQLHNLLKEKFNVQVEGSSFWFSNKEIADQAAEYMNSLLLMNKLKG